VTAVVLQHELEQRLGGGAPEPLVGWIEAYAGAIGGDDEAASFHGELLVARFDRVVVHRTYRGAEGRRYRIGSVTKPPPTAATSSSWWARARFELQLQSDGALAQPRLKLTVTPERRPDGGIEALVLRQGGLTLIYRRSEDASSATIPRE
jgi:hypothetical protein